MRNGSGLVQIIPTREKSFVRGSAFGLPLILVLLFVLILSAVIQYFQYSLVLPYLTFAPVSALFPFSLLQLSCVVLLAVVIVVVCFCCICCFVKFHNMRVSLWRMQSMPHAQRVAHETVFFCAFKPRVQGFKLFPFSLKSASKPLGTTCAARCCVCIVFQQFVETEASMSSGEVVPGQIPTPYIFPKMSLGS